MFLTAINVLTITACIFCWPRLATAQRTPTDIELRTAYCIELISSYSNETQKYTDKLLDSRTFKGPLDPSVEKELEGLFAAQRQRREEDERILRRFRLYLLPRLPEIDMLQVTIAVKRGEEDAKRFYPGIDACTESCQVPAENYKSCTESCFKNKGLYAIGDQLKLCQAPTWLPF